MGNPREGAGGVKLDPFQFQSEKFQKVEGGSSTNVVKMNPFHSFQPCIPITRVMISLDDRSKCKHVRRVEQETVP